MRRFGLNASYEDASTPDAGNRFASPRLARSGPAAVSTSVSLCCTSPDSRSMHSLATNCGEWYLETRSLPLDTAEAQQGESDQDELPAVIQTVLPPWLQSTLNAEPPKELLCVQGDGKAAPSSSSQSQRVQQLPRLCLYTDRTVLLFDIVCDLNGERVRGQGRGEIISIDQPFQEHFLNSSSSQKILRIRPAPHVNQGFSVFGPAGGSLAMLTHCREFNQYSVSLYHKNGDNNNNNNSMVTTPVVYEFEQQVDSGLEIVDFMFAQSNGLSLFSSMSILLLRRSGDVLAASPVIFDGTVVPRTMLDEGLEYIAHELERLGRATPTYRQYMAAQHYLLNVFPRQDQRSQFVTATLGPAAQGEENLVMRWPAKIQGPVVFCSSEEPGPPAVVIENFGSTDMLGVAIGKAGGNVDLAVVAPTAVLPRFTLEDMEDGYDLDDHVCKLGRVVDRVALVGSSDAGATQGVMSLLKDPIVDSLLYCVTPTAVRIVSTNVMRVTQRRLVGGSDEPVHTTAWSCLNAAGQSAVQGIAASGDAAFGHVLVARLADGSLIPVNVTESQTVHEVDMLMPRVAEEQRRLLASSGGHSATDEALHNMEAMPLFYDAIKPLLQKVHAGLGGMGRIVGTETRYTDITPDTLAVANHTKERCDKEVVLPLLELSKLVQKRREQLKLVVASQQKQAAVLNKTVSDLQARMESITEKMAIAETNANVLSQRSSSVLQSAQDMLPSITEAEYEYFQLLKSLQARCDRDEARLKQLNKEFAKQRTDIGDKKITFPDDNKMVGSAHKTLIGAEVVLKGAKGRLNKSELELKRFTAVASRG